MLSINFIAFATLLLPTLGLATSAVPFNASYDDKVTLPANGQATPVGTYKGLTYSPNFLVAKLSILDISASGLIPHSISNTALFPDGALLPGPQSISTVGTKTKSFTLSSFYYGCVLGDFNSVISDAVACTITATGYKAGSSSPFASQVFTFTPEQKVDVMNPMTLGTFTSKFTGLTNVTLTIKSAVTPVAGNIDNLVGTTTS